MTQMTTFDAVMTAEMYGVNLEDGALEGVDVRAAWQHLVDTGLAWSLQGWFGRTATRLIDIGEISASSGPEETISLQSRDRYAG